MMAAGVVGCACFNIDNCVAAPLARPLLCLVNQSRRKFKRDPRPRYVRSFLRSRQYATRIATSAWARCRHNSWVDFDVLPQSEESAKPMFKLFRFPDLLLLLPVLFVCGTAGYA